MTAKILRIPNEEHTALVLKVRREMGIGETVRLETFRPRLAERDGRKAVAA